MPKAHRAIFDLLSCKCNRQRDAEDRIAIMEMAWMVVLADGQMHEYEAQLMRRLAGLLFVEDVDSGRAAKRARARLDRAV